MTRHYITVKDNFIQDGFSDDFKEPSAGDICIEKDGGRQFRIKGITNPDLLDEDGFSKYKFINGKVELATPNEQPEFLKNKKEKEYKIKKAKIREQVRKQIITVSGKKYDGDEDSQNRMMRALLSMNDQEKIDWILVDNSIIKVKKADLSIVLSKAFKNQISIWTKNKEK